MYNFDYFDQVVSQERFSAGDVDMMELPHVEVGGNLLKGAHNLIGSQFVIKFHFFRRRSAMDAPQVAAPGRFPTDELQGMFPDERLDASPPSFPESMP